VTQTPLGQELVTRVGANGDAVFSSCERYRYNLTRKWVHQSKTSRRFILWVLLNPSTADENKLDPTLTRCAEFSRSWGYDGMIVRNVFAYRTPSPKVMLQARNSGIDIIGPANDLWLNDHAGVALTIVGWGALPLARDRAEQVVKLLGPGLLCMGLNNGGSPKHPLYLSKQTRPIPFSLVFGA
jgi:hypothetical protein